MQLKIVNLFIYKDIYRIAFNLTCNGSTMNNYLLVSDVGSTTTKLLLLEIRENDFIAVASVATSTTVERPKEDVCVGFLDGVAQLQKSSGIILLDENNELTVPYYTTSSAGGGLQILVVALASSDSGSIAKAVTFGAGGVVLDSFAIDDDLPRVEKIRRMKHLSPDLVLMAGGYDNGAIAGVVNMAQLVAFSKPKPKFGKKKLPLIFCGNPQVRPFILGMLGDLFNVSFTDNIRPDGLTFNLKPAIEETHKLFMDHVMQMAPGYSRLSEMTSFPILPTPAGVNQILKEYSKILKTNVILADMGGATTDIFSNIQGELQRTVAANTGMSYSISNIVKEAGIENIKAHIPTIQESTARDWILSKTLFPTIVPSDDTCEAVECAAAAEGMHLAWKHHLEIGYIRQRVGFTEKVRRLGKCKFDAAFRTNEDKKFRLSSISVIIGAGGIMAHSSPRRAAWILTSGFHPKGLTTLMVDQHFHSPHAGILTTNYPSRSLKYYTEECLKTVCRVYSPLDKVRKLRVKVDNSTRTVKSGGFLYLEQSKGVKISGIALPQDDIPLLIDCRFGDELLPMDFLETPQEFSKPSEMPSSSLPENRIRQFSKEFNLAYKGEILVKEGNSVKAGDKLGVNRLIPPRIFFVDIRGHVGYSNEKVTNDLIMSNVLVKVGEKVKVGQTVFEISIGNSFTGFSDSVLSPVRGIVDSIVYPGMIILKEIQDFDGKPSYINVARLLGVKPRQIGTYMKVLHRDFVEQGQVIAIGEKLKYIKSETTGTVLEVDRKTGIVTIQYVLEPTEVFSPMAGIVSEANRDMKVVLASKGVTLPGVAGFGQTAFGSLSDGEMLKGAIVLLRTPLTQALIDEAIDREIAGVIAPSISGVDLIEFLGAEPGVILTGTEDLPFSLLIVKGIGNHTLESVEYGQFSNFFGKNCVLFTTTRLRAGVERPYLFIQTEEED